MSVPDGNSDNGISAIRQFVELGPADAPVWRET